MNYSNNHHHQYHHRPNATDSRIITNFFRHCHHTPLWTPMSVVKFSLFGLTILCILFLMSELEQLSRIWDFSSSSSEKHTLVVGKGGRSSYIFRMTPEEITHSPPVAPIPSSSSSLLPPPQERSQKDDDSDDVDIFVQHDTEKSLSITTPNMTIIVLSMDRFTSLQRLLLSLYVAKYPITDRIDLTVRFDRPPLPSTSGSTTMMTQWKKKLETVRDSMIEHWPYGKVTMVISKTNIGLAQAWKTAWNPSSDEDRAVILEDDLELSPVWYQWLQGMHDMYQHRTDVAAFSLQHQLLVPLKGSPKKKTQVFPKNEPFLYALMGSHGFSPLARVWKEFVGFVRCQARHDTSVSVPNLVTSDWYEKPFNKKSMWTQHFIYFTYHRRLYTIYQYPKDKAFAAHWQEKGEHFNGKNVKRNFPLIQDGDFSMSFPPKLKKYDWGANQIVEDGDDTTLLPPMVMSVAIGYQMGRFKAFVGTLRDHYDGDAHLLISNDTSPEIRTYLDEHNVHTVETNLSEAEYASPEWEEINRQRFDFYVRVCDKAKYSLCLSTDFRDSIFQSNPFTTIDRSVMKRDAPPVLYLFEHNTEMNDFHFDLMNRPECNLYTQYAQVLVGTQIINGGSIIGSPQAFEQIVRYMRDVWKGCNDQVTLNILARANMFSNDTKLTVYPQGYGEVNVVGYGGIIYKDSKKFLNRNCIVSPVVHQYDCIHCDEEDAL